MSYNVSVNVDAEVDISVTVRNLDGSELPDSAFEVDTSYEEIKITLKKMPDRYFRESKILERIKDLAKENCPSFLPVLERLERELEMERFRPTSEMEQ